MKPQFLVRCSLFFFLALFGFANNSQAATINVVDQDDPSGLTPSCDNNVQGSELAPTLTAPNWSAGTGWSVSGGQITFTGTNTSTIYPSTPISVQSGKRYRVSITANATSGTTITGSLGGTALTSITYNWASAYTFTTDLTAQNTNNLVLSGDNGGASPLLRLQ